VIECIERLSAAPSPIRYHCPDVRTFRSNARWFVALIAPWVVAACVPRDQDGFDSIGPSHRLNAIVQAADQSDDASLCGLIQQLDSDDPAARLLAIRALEKRTGQTLDYRHDDPPWKRSQGVDRWMEWYGSRDVPPGGAAAPQTAPQTAAVPEGR
jgi:hypothetical protein